MPLIKGGEAYARSIGVKAGKGCRFYTRYWGSEPFLISIGDNVIIASGVKFLTHDGALGLMKDDKGRRYTYSPIEIGSNVFIGINSIIMPGIRIGDRVIVAAGSVITKSVPSGTIVAGVPARIIGSYDEFEEKTLRDEASQKDMDFNMSYKERVLSVAHTDFKPYMTK